MLPALDVVSTVSAVASAARVMPVLRDSEVG